MGWFPGRVRRFSGKARSNSGNEGRNSGDVRRKSADRARNGTVLGCFAQIQRGKEGEGRNNEEFWGQDRWGLAGKSGDGPARGERRAVYTNEGARPPQRFMRKSMGYLRTVNSLAFVGSAPRPQGLALDAGVPAGLHKRLLGRELETATSWRLPRIRPQETRTKVRT